ncbi:hypothetical protein [Parahaliea mediterranea]|uniref:Tetratricopeptide repeat protein n=1 Tax=Parahaliea mediterranea TaxID=651086 RepID=A0A939DDZ1_9GAMM|nr:hypothetical protein [Parahaliea mediterranea]MBN7796299.1 hypothetical protein [Parahaliea mediterranea]
MAIDTAAAYGARLVRAEQTWPDGTPEVPRPPAAPAGAGREAYAAAIEDAQLAGGPYQAGLEEPLRDLARWHWARGELAEAGRQLDRALHILRINEGLRSERQVSLLRDQIALSRAAGDLARLDDRQAYLYFLAASGQPLAGEDNWHATLDYLRWQREALRSGLGGDQRRLQALVDLNEDLLDADAAAGPEALPPARRWLLVQSQLRNLYLLQSSIPEPGYRPGAMSAGAFYTPGRDMDALEAERRRLDNLRRGGMMRGAQLLQDFAGSQAAGSALGRDARLALADWYQWHGATRDAAEIYRQLAAELAAAGEGETLQQWFGAPVELPDNGAFWQAPAPGQAAEAVVRARFTVSARGRVRELGIDTVPEAQVSAASRLRRALREVRFRPRFESGEPVSSPAVERSYAWLPLRRSR